MKRIVYILSEVDCAPMFSWIARSRIGDRHMLSFVLLNSHETALERELRDTGCEVVRVPYAGRRDAFAAFCSVWRILRARRPDSVHAHMHVANTLGLAAAWIARVKRRIYTRHHTDWNRQGPWHARAYDFLANFFATDVVATCENVADYLRKEEKVRPTKVHLVPFGFREDAFIVTPARVAAVKEKYRLEGRWPVVGVISRYVPYKDVPAAIEAFSRLRVEFPSACLVLANAGHGADLGRVKTALAALPTDAYREIRFEEDSPALMGSFDLFVHLPVDPVCEAFGQVYVEALLNGVPSVFTLSGVAPEFVRHERNALVVHYRDPAQACEAMRRLLRDPSLAHALAEHGARDARAAFPWERMIAGLEEVYR